MLQSQTIEALSLHNLSNAKRIRSEKKVIGSSDDAYAFIITSLKLIFPKIGYRKLKKSITDDYDDACFDVIYLDETEKKIYIMDIKKSEGFKVATTQALKNSLDDYIFSRPNNYDNVNENVKIKIEEIHEKLRENWKILLFVIRGKKAKPTNQVKLIIDELKNG